MCPTESSWACTSAGTPAPCTLHYTEPPHLEPHFSHRLLTTTTSQSFQFPSVQVLVSPGERFGTSIKLLSVKTPTPQDPPNYDSIPVIPPGATCSPSTWKEFSFLFFPSCGSREAQNQMLVKAKPVPVAFLPGIAPKGGGLRWHWGGVFRKGAWHCSPAVWADLSSLPCPFGVQESKGNAQQDPIYILQLFWAGEEEGN